MSTLTRERIEEIITRDDDPLVLTPLLTKQQIGIASVDVRLGNQFIVFRLHAVGAYPSDTADDARRIQERHVLRFGTPFVLHPGMLALAATLEYVKMPLDIECQVEGRSSWARVGLAVATATTVEPGFRGVVTLELSNVGSVPLYLHPGVRIAQLLFRDVQPGATGYGEGRKYHCPVGPQFSRIKSDNDSIVFRKPR